MSYDPADITRCKVDAITLYVVNVVHSPPEGDLGTANIPNNTLGSTSRSRSIQDIGWMVCWEDCTLSNSIRGLHKLVVVLVKVSIQSVSVKLTIELMSLLNQAG